MELSEVFDELEEIYNEELDEDYFFEKVTLDTEFTGLPYNLWLDSSGKDRINTHNLPRLKVDIDDTHKGGLPITIDEKEPVVPKSVKKKRTFKDMGKVQKFITDHYPTLIKHWNRELTDRELFIELEKEINKE